MHTNDREGRARHSVRAVLGQTDDGAHGVTRPTRTFSDSCPLVSIRG